MKLGESSNAAVIIYVGILEFKAFNKKCIRADILLVGPLNSSKSQTNPLEVAKILQLTEDWVIKIGFYVKSPETSVTKFQVERKIIISLHRGNFVQF